MRRSTRFGSCGLASMLVIALAGCAPMGSAPDLESSGTFPLPEALEPNVEFWRNVYATWSRSQVAIHDNRYLDVVYQVADLPGPIEASYTARQRDFVEALKRSWSSRLARMSSKLAAGTPLTSDEDALRKRLIAAGGQAALYDPAERVRSQRGLRERFGRGIEVSGRYDAKFREIFRRHGVPEDLAYLPHVESSFQLNARSSAGASGVWQFIRSTGRRYMIVNAQIDERLDPVIAADAAARYLAEAHRTLGSWPLAITSYNHGVGGMRNAKALYGNDIARIVQSYQGRYFGFASRNFYAEFLAARHVASHAERYFPGTKREPPLDHRQVRLTRSETAGELARRYQVPVHELIRANPAWQAPIRESRVPVPVGSLIWLPGTQSPSLRSTPRRDPIPSFGHEPRPDPTQARS